MEAITISFQELNYALNTLYLLIASSLVIWMMLGFTLLECGLSKTQSFNHILIKNFSLFAMASLVYLGMGYDVMFNSTEAGFLPSLEHVFDFMFNPHQTMAWSNGMESFNLSESAFFFFQGMCGMVCVFIISLAMTDRLGSGAFWVFSIVMLGLIYPVQGYWNWGGGFLEERKFVDFAGSGTVHLAGASAALAGLFLFKPRQINHAENIHFVVLGSMMLWIGGLGFNGGSQLLISTPEDAGWVALVVLNTHLSISGGLLGGLFVSRFLKGHIELNQVVRGAIAGLIAITAGPVTPLPFYAVLIGVVGGTLTCLVIFVLEKLKADSSGWATVATHGVGGIWGLLAVPMTNLGAGFVNQILGLVVIFCWVFTTSFVIWLIIKLILERQPVQV